MRAKRVTVEELLERVPARLRPVAEPVSREADRRRHDRLIEWLLDEGLGEVEALEVSLELKRRAARR